jgi:hypothetical protein
MRRLLHRFFWRELYWKIRHLFFPQQKWARKVIPRGWADKPELVRDFLFAALVDYVECEEGLDGLWCESFYKPDLDKGYISQDLYDERKAIREKIEAVYAFIKEELPRLEAEHENSYPERLDPNGSLLSDFVKSEKGDFYTMKSCEEIYGAPYHVVYAEHNRLEELIRQKTNWACATIVEVREYLWT